MRTILALLAIAVLGCGPKTTTSPKKTSTTPDEKGTVAKPKLPAHRTGSTGRHWDTVLRELNAPTGLAKRGQDKIFKQYGVKMAEGCTRLYDASIFTPQDWGKVAFLTGTPTPAKNPCGNKGVKQPPPVLCILHIDGAGNIAGKLVSRPNPDTTITGVTFKVLESGHHIVTAKSKNWTPPVCEEDESPSARARAVEEEEGKPEVENMSLYLFEANTLHTLYFGEQSMESRDSFGSTSAMTTVDVFYVKSLKTLVLTLSRTMEVTRRSMPDGNERRTCIQSSDVYLMEGTKKTMSLAGKAKVAQLKKNKEFKEYYAEEPEGNCSNDSDK